MGRSGRQLRYFRSLLVRNAGNCEVSRCGIMPGGTACGVKSSPLSRTVSILLHSIAGLASLPVVAATVTWDAPQAVTGDSDVKTLYSLDRAHLFGATTATVNGVPFKAW